MKKQIDWKYHGFAWGSFCAYIIGLHLILAIGFAVASFVSWENHFYYYMNLPAWDGFSRFMYLACYMWLVVGFLIYLYAVIFKGSAFIADNNT